MGISHCFLTKTTIFFTTETEKIVCRSIKAKDILIFPTQNYQFTIMTSYKLNRGFLFLLDIRW